MNITVTKCKDCPFRVIDNEYGDYCYFSDMETETANMIHCSGYYMPTNCPLLKCHVNVEAGNNIIIEQT
jgi:hypothetical protein